MLAVERQSSQARNTQGSNQIQDVIVPRLKWKANLSCYKCGEKGHLAQECPQTG